MVFVAGCPDPEGRGTGRPQEVATDMGASCCGYRSFIRAILGAEMDDTVADGHKEPHCERDREREP